ncbi:NAD(P)-dependent oxidoreductase [Devosia algicola]|uniref:NAD(P)-dependent oxidoreductase n=1 Tax=Devosia algicola TaxID=3026418 RepID=A0ABY7YSX4_9HYPH|nr:NAD(P)-dependent oxidoreductase [Devosia algicola]WDR04351.1 NAD(P)-dependent oxidoreductase [Devosia algicola]
MTGAGGLVGAHIMHSLAQMSTIRPIGVVRRPLSDLVNGEQVVVDLTVGNECEELASLSPSVIVHAAAVLPNSLDDEHAAAANTQIDSNILELAIACDARVIFVSSVSVYANSALPWTEASEIGPLPAYPASKYATEKKIQRLDAANYIMRISSPYSATHQGRQGVLYNFVRQAVAGQDLVVVGTGDRTQDFIHAQDIGSAVRLAVIRMVGHDASRFSDIYNIVNGSPISMRLLAEKIVNICGAGRIVYSDDHGPANFYRAQLSRERAMANLNWKPSVPIEPWYCTIGTSNERLQ